MLKALAKELLKKLPIAITRNQRYDRQTRRVLARVLRADSNCVDVGCHEGEVLWMMNRLAPQGTHHAFEPLPTFYEHLRQTLPANCRVFPLALSNRQGSTTFQHVLTDPAYSGLRQRHYDHKQVDVREITVKTDLLDHILPPDLPIHLIKIDVEGAELLVLEGSRRTLSRWRPYVIFEHGLGAADVYGARPEAVYQLFREHGRLSVTTMRRWLEGSPPFTEEEFARAFETNQDYYFLAYPDRDQDQD